MANEYEYYRIVKDTNRYPGIAPKVPDFITVWSSLAQARELARILTNREAGCDFAFYVDGDEKDG